MEQAIEQGADRGGIAEQLAPVHGAIRGEERRDSFVSAHDDLEQVLGGVREFPHPEVIELCGAPHNSTNGERPVMWSAAAPSEESPDLLHA
jgi:hypothetical protein